MLKRKALLIGVGKYNNYLPLISPAKDVRALEKTLKDKNIGRFDEVATVVDKTNQFVDKEIHRFLDQQTPDDLLLIYFSGHGDYSVDDELFFIFPNTTTERYFLSPATAIASKYLTGRITACRARKKILILDCCYSGLAGKHKGGLREPQEQDFGKISHGEEHSFVILTSSKSTQSSWDNSAESKDGLSLFTHYLIHGLTNNQVESKNGEIKLYDWFKYAKDQVKEVSRRSQIPQIFAYKDLDVTIAYSNALTTQPAGNPSGSIVTSPVPIRNEKMTFIGMDFVRIPAGKFMMGCNDYADERPQHQVKIPYDYWMGKHLVTNEQYFKFVKAEGKPHPVHDWQTKRKHPVVNTTWGDANLYVQWLNKTVSLPHDLEFCLPTEAEWEKAARHPDGRIYPWGNTFDLNKCNSREGGKNDTTPVGFYSPRGDSFCGCADMAGNVWEWTCSIPKEYPYDSSDGCKENNDNVGHVLRGGSHYSNKDKVRTSERDNYQPIYETSDCRGIRVVVVPRFIKRV